MNGKGLQCYTSKDIHGPWKHHNMKGRIYDLSVLFDDDGKIYAIHGYGEVHCTELLPDMSGPKEETDRVIIPKGSAVGEGHHMYKINGMYYLISTDYQPNGRTLCSRSKSIWGPYETCVITADETFGYHPVGLTQVKGRIVPDGSHFGIGHEDVNATACTNIHQGGIVQTQNGDWYALLMMDFHSIGRTVTLAPITWKDGWPMLGLEGNLGLRRAHGPSPTYPELRTLLPTRHTTATRPSTASSSDGCGNGTTTPTTACGACARGACASTPCPPSSSCGRATRSPSAS